MENVYLDSKPWFGINAFKVADSAYKRTLGQSILINVFEVKIFNAIVFKVTLQKKISVVFRILVLTVPAQYLTAYFTFW